MCLNLDLSLGLGFGLDLGLSLGLGLFFWFRLGICDIFIVCLATYMVLAFV